MANPSEQVRDTFRTRNAGNVEIQNNSKPATDNFHIDRARLGVHEEYDPDVPNDWGGKGKVVPKTNSIMDNVRGAMGGCGAVSSFRSVHDPKDPTCTESPCCPSPYSYGSSARNPLTRKKGD